MSFNPVFWLVPCSLSIGHPRKARTLQASPASFLAGQGRSLLGFIIPTAGTGDFTQGVLCVRDIERDDEREMEEAGRGRVHVAAVAQLVREERKRLEQIHPKACWPTCLYTHTHARTAMCSFAYPSQYWEYGTVFSVWEACGSLLPLMISGVIITSSICVLISQICDSLQKDILLIN